MRVCANVRQGAHGRKLFFSSLAVKDSLHKAVCRDADAGPPVWRRCVQTYHPKVFIYLAEMVFIAENVEEILVLLSSPSHGASCVSQWSYCLSVHVHTWDTVHAVHGYIASQCTL